MKKFKVLVTRKVASEQTIVVEAENREDAEEQVMEAPPSCGWKTIRDGDEFEAEAERIDPPYDTVDFPAYALSALINDDISGLSADDLKHLHNWTREVETRIRANHGQKCEIIYQSGEDTYFSTAQVFGLPCECVELEIHVIPANPLHEENLK